jgi:ribosomal protein L5
MRNAFCMLLYIPHIQNNMSRLEHYERVVVWDRIARYPELVHATQVPKIDGLVLHWSLRSVGMNAESSVAAMTGLYRRTGHMPKVHKTTESLAVWKLREGDIVACSVSLSREEAMSFLETWMRLVLPQMRSFEGRSAKMIDSNGGVSFPRSNPMQFPSLEPMYERLNPRCSRPGLMMNLQIKGAKNKAIVQSMLTGRGIPRVD